MLFADENPKNLPNNQIVEERNLIRNNLYNMLSFSKAGIVAGIIKIPPKEERILPYSELPRTQEDENKINELITTMGTHGKIDLLLNYEKRLRKIGDELRYIHPLKFIGYIFSHKDSNGIELKKHMATVFDDYFKRVNFVKDFGQTMDMYDLKNQLSIYLNDFTNEVKINPSLIQQFFDKNNKDYGNWEGLIKVLINN